MNSVILVKDVTLENDLLLSGPGIILKGSKILPGSRLEEEPLEYDKDFENDFYYENEILISACSFLPQRTILVLPETSLNLLSKSEYQEIGRENLNQFPNLSDVIPMFIVKMYNIYHLRYLINLEQEQLTSEAEESVSQFSIEKSDEDNEVPKLTSKIEETKEIIHKLKTLKYQCSNKELVLKECEKDFKTLCEQNFYSNEYTFEDIVIFREQLQRDLEKFFPQCYSNSVEVINSLIEKVMNFKTYLEEIPHCSISSLKEKINALTQSLNNKDQEIKDLVANYEKQILLLRKIIDGKSDYEKMYNAEKLISDHLEAKNRKIPEIIAKLKQKIEDRILYETFFCRIPADKIPEVKINEYKFLISEIESLFCEI